jgi:hypothetical protein
VFGKKLKISGAATADQVGEKRHQQVKSLRTAHSWKLTVFRQGSQENNQISSGIGIAQGREQDRQKRDQHGHTS